MTKTTALPGNHLLLDPCVGEQIEDIRERWAMLLNAGRIKPETCIKMANDAEIRLHQLTCRFALLRHDAQMVIDKRKRRSS